MKEYRLPMNGKWAINQKFSQDEVAAVTARLNEPSNLKNIIEGSNEASELITSEDLADGTKISLLHPSGPYTDRAIMLGAYNSDFQSKHGTQWIYDYPTQTQEKYWEYVVTGLIAGRQVLEDEGREHLESLYVENSTLVSNGAFRTSRTIKFPHGQFIEIDRTQLIPHTLTLHHLREEWEVLNRGFLVERFVGRLSREMEAYLDEEPEISSQNQLPFGYRFSVPNSGGIATQKVTEIMKAHHLANESLSSKYLDAARSASGFSQVQSGFRERLDRVIPSPSYRVYMELGEERDLNVIIAPEFISHAGVMQAKGIDLDRDPKHPVREFGTPQARSEYAQKFVSVMQRERAKLE